MASRDREAISIGEVAGQAGIATSAIRYYEHIGLLPLAKRVAGRRVYDQSVYARLSMIDLAKRSGFSLAEIRTLVAGFGRHSTVSARWKLLAASKLDELDALIAEAEQMKDVLSEGLACPCTSPAVCRVLTLAPPSAR